MVGFQGWRFGGCWVGFGGGVELMGGFWWCVSVIVVSLMVFGDGGFQW